MVPTGRLDRINLGTVGVSIKGQWVQVAEENSPFPLTSVAAVERHEEHICDEQGMSFLRYCSLTTFCTRPLRVDLIKTLLVMLLALGSAASPLLRLFMVFQCRCDGRGRVGILWRLKRLQVDLQSTYISMEFRDL